MRGGLSWSDKDRQALKKLWELAEQEEPLGHQLLREAKEVAAHSPSSAFLICYTALEVGLKQHIARCDPVAGWFALKVPSPQLSKILKNFLPKIHAQNNDFQNWERAKVKFNIVDKFGDERNGLAHSGEKSAARLDEYIRLTADLLFAFDVFEGHSWAKAHVSREFGNLMGWETNGRGYLKITLKC